MLIAVDTGGTFTDVVCLRARGHRFCGPERLAAQLKALCAESHVVLARVRYLAKLAEVTDATVLGSWAVDRQAGHERIVGGREA